MALRCQISKLIALVVVDKITAFTVATAHLTCGFVLASVANISSVTLANFSG